MSHDLGTYSFLPWLRQGLANQIQSADFDAAVKLRAEVNVQLELSGEKIDGSGREVAPVQRKVALFGPGDVVGIDRSAIVRVEPRDWTTNFEPNYLAQIEFYDEDFPWRYTPAAPDLGSGRLRPWLALIVLAEGEFTDGINVKDRPLPFIDVADLSVFPRADELWAWAHVHVNQPLTANADELVSNDMNAVLPKLQTLLGQSPDLAYSRIVCPRKLAEKTAYHAFLVPVFETGRRAGLGLELGDVPATTSAWDPGARPEAQSFPYYHRWFFRTGVSGDFETLVRLLVPKPVDRRVGTREMDVVAPAPGVAGVDKPELGGILKLGGALRPPTPSPAPPPDVFETWDDPFPRPIQQDLARLINLADDYRANGDPDPIVTPPLYGTWHALTQRVLTERNGTPAAFPGNWVHRLNLDPRFRAAAGIGTSVIQDNQEKYMEAAWQQVGKVLEAQRKVRLGQLGLGVSEIWFDRHLLPMLGVSRQRALLLIAPLNKRILNAGETVHHQLKQALVQPALTSAALRRTLRPRGRLIRSLPFDARRTPDRLLARVNARKASAAPPKVAPPGVLTTNAATKLVGSTSAPGWLEDWLRRAAYLPKLVLLLALLLALLVLVLLGLPPPLALGIALGVTVVGLLVARWLSRIRQQVVGADALLESNQTPEAVDALPGVPGFVLSEPDAGVSPSGSGPDSVEAARFKEALKQTFALLQASAAAGARVKKTRLDLKRLAEHSVREIAPRRVLPKRIRAGITLPQRILGDLVATPAEAFVEPMAYPVIDQPMYEPLKDRSAELFLPNINLIEQNSITLLETNQRFIEAYMVGLNHEFSRELLWREYPTDQRGTSFRQFWDVSGFFAPGQQDDEAKKEQLRDIPPLHLWSKSSELGDHDHREINGEKEDELVLVIRGELLKRYPTAVIYAHRACWQRKVVTAADRDLEPCLRSGAIDNTQERRLAPLTPAEEDSPPREKVLTPLYEAKVDPDIYFFGFDLTAAEAKGGTGENPNDDPGWFFVIKERPGEPRFGLDTEQPTTRSVWNDLSWQDVQPGPAGSHIEIASAPASFPLSVPGAEDQEKAEQHEDDKKVVWGHGMSSAELAYILWQAPVLVAVHASEMLPKEE